jgi:four helix bundle protein
MSRDYRKLRTFNLADELVLQVYGATANFPQAERYGLQAQIRRAAVSVAANIVEGSARRSNSEYLNFLNIAAASAAETRYLVDLSHRLGFVSPADVERLKHGYTEVAGSLVSLIQSLAGQP